ncbi:MAG: hypothetical protein GX357_01585 [Firmicutes bacterium]|nr:hypothetical protein [Bacillota bacterium]
MRKIKIWLSLSLALGIFLGSTLLGATGEQPTPKDETVYGILAADGTVKEIYVVNGFSLEQAGTVFDVGDYAEVSNLTSTAEIVTAKDQISVTADKGRFFYQGKLAKTQLPWLFRLSYRLDGQEISARELAGKSGLLELELEIKKNPHVDPWFFKNITMQVSVTLDTEKFTEINTKDATIVSVGKDKQLNYTVFPGNEKTISLTAQVNEFTLPPLQISGTVMQLQFAEENLEQFTEPFGQLQSGIAELDHGARQLQEGTAELASGLQELSEGGRQFSAGLQQLQANMSAFTGGTGELAAGGGEIHNGVAQLASGLTQLAAEDDKLLAGAEQIFTALLASANTQLEPLFRQLKNANVTVEQLTRENYAVVLANLSTQLQQMPGASSQIQLLQALEAQLNGYNEFYQGLQNYTDGVAQAAKAGSRLAEGTATLKGGADELNLHAGELASAVGMMAINAEKLSTGLQEAQLGSVALNEGATLLAEGMGELSEKTAGFDTELATSALDSLLGERSGPMRSFVAPRNKAVQTLQFIIRTEEISAPQITEPVPETAETASKQTFWQKLLALFGLLQD